MIVSAAFNILPDGTIITEGVHSPGTSSTPWELLGISSRRKSIGIYEIFGPSISWPEGWKIAIYKDENEIPTSFVGLEAGDGFVCVNSYHIDDNYTHIDITNMMTVRVMVDINGD